MLHDNRQLLRLALQPDSAAPFGRTVADLLAEEVRALGDGPARLAPHSIVAVRVHALTTSS